MTMTREQFRVQGGGEDFEAVDQARAGRLK